MKEQAECGCKAQALIIPVGQAIYLSCIAIALLFFIFVGGYYLGYSKATRQLGLQAEQDSFADAIEYSLATQFGSAASTGSEDGCLDENDEGVDEGPPEEEEKEVESKEMIEEPIGPRYQALLFGGTKKEVEQFAEKMNEKDFPVEVRRRVSTSKKGAQYIWYQAVTKPLPNKQVVDTMVDKIKKYGRLKKVRIVEVV